MRRQVEDVRVADVVAVGEGHVHREQREHQDRARLLITDARLQQARGREHRPGDAELLPAGRTSTSRGGRRSSDCGTFITIVSRQSDFVTSNQNAAARHRSRAAGPAAARAFAGSTRTAARRPRRRRPPCAMMRGARHRPPAARCRRQQKDRVAGQQAGSSTGGCRSRARSTAKNSEQPAGRRHARPPQQQQQRQRDERDVQGVDLGDDRLAPERVGRREQQRGADGGGDRSRQLGGRRAR